MGRRRCCCDEECWVRTDDFNRTGGTDLGSNWNEVVGNWDIVGYPPDGELHELAGGTTGTADAVIIYNEPVPFRSKGEMSISVAVIDAVEGDVFYIYPACQTSVSKNTICGKFTKMDANANGIWKVELGGVAVNVTCSSVGGEVSISVCVDWGNNMMGASISHMPPEPDIWIDNANAGDGRYAGLGHNNTNTGAYFDDFFVSELRKNEELSGICHQCWCQCWEIPIPKTLNLLIHGESGTRASCLEGVTFALVWDFGGGIPFWYGYVDFYSSVAAGYNGVGFRIEAWLKCAAGGDDDPAWPGKNFTLQLAFHELVDGVPDPGATMCCVAVGAQCASSQSLPPDPGSSAGPHWGPIYTSCDPLILIFGAYTLPSATCYLCYHPSPIPPNPNPPTGYYWVEVTL